jgi:hypothetical protein
MVASLVVSLILWFGAGLDPDEPSQWATIMIATVVSSTVVWVSVTFMTQPERPEVLDRFYTKVRPGGRGWRAVAVRLGFGPEGMDGGALNWTNWIAGVTAVYSSLFGIGKLIFGDMGAATTFLVIAGLSFAWIARNLRDMPPDRVFEEPSR